jgi:glycine/D-amino acid oxidase-like deaminating enzyme
MNTTTWEKEARDIKKDYPALDKDIDVDVAIIGGGIAGILNAYRLTKMGKKVALLEKNELGKSATICTTAFITKVIDTDLSECLDILGSRDSKLVWDSGQNAVKEFEKMIKKEDIECEFTRVSNFIFASDKKQVKDIEKEYEAYKKLRIKASFSEIGEDLGFNNLGYLEVPDQAKFNVSKFIYKLVEIIKKSGGQIFEKTEVEGLEDVKEGIVVRTKRGIVTARDVIIATYKPLTQRRTHLKKAMYKSYVFELEVPKG